MRKTKDSGMGWRSFRIQVTGTKACVDWPESLIRATMDFRIRHRCLDTGRNWWVITVRLLAFGLALAFAVSTASLSDDVAFHSGHDSSTKVLTVSAAPHADAAEPGFACHLHCGCHQVVSVPAVDLTMPCPETVPTVYARLNETALFTAPGRLPRPPRA
jgi:hypothetical protein